MKPTMIGLVGLALGLAACADELSRESPLSLRDDGGIAWGGDVECALICQFADPNQGFIIAEAFGETPEECHEYLPPGTAAELGCADPPPGEPCEDGATGAHCVEAEARERVHGSLVGKWFTPKVAAILAVLVGEVSKEYLKNQLGLPDGALPGDLAGVLDDAITSGLGTGGTGAKVLWEVTWEKKKWLDGLKQLMGQHYFGNGDGFWTRSEAESLYTKRKQAFQAKKRN